ncbi:hypothetical protein HY386_00055 [Candidatus Daviesbacteria bacterium]|nr:hypothetical protein [Candidatus Daviesbacteria bacterium]
MSKPKISKDIIIPLDILPKLLTPSESRMLKNRWQILNLLENGLPIRAIAEKVKVGTDTVVRTARLREKMNLRGATAEKNRATIKTKTPWIFGKND